MSDMSYLCDMKLHPEGVNTIKESCDANVKYKLWWLCEMQAVVTVLNMYLFCTN